MRYALTLIAVLALAGCTSSAQRFAAWEDDCAARGFDPAGDPFRYCVLELQAQYQNERYAKIGAFSGAFRGAYAPIPTHQSLRRY